jgi:hypothetical protein
MWTRLDLRALLWFAGLIVAIACAKMLMEILPERGLASGTGWLYWWARVSRSDLVVFLFTLTLLYVISGMSWGHGAGVVG